MPEQGAIDADFDDAELSYEQRVANALDDVQTEPVAGGVAIDIVTRQPVFVRQCTYDSLEAHYEAEGYDLATYKMHAFLPGVDTDNAVYECVYVDGNPAEAHKQSKTYDFPEGRLMHLPVEMSWSDMEVGDV